MANGMGKEPVKPPHEELERLERAAAVAAATVENMVEGVFVLDYQGRLISVNPAGLELHGFESYDEVPVTLAEMEKTFIIRDWSGKEIAQHDWPAARALAGHRVRDFAMRVERRDTGRSWYGTYSATPIFEAGRVTHVVVTVHDQTELVQTTETLRRVNELSNALSADLNLDRIVQSLTDACTEVTGAEFGAFFYNLINADGESYTLYSLSGVPREAFSSFPMPRNTDIFGPTFRGEGIVRIDDVTADPRYGKSAPYQGMPPGHLPVASYLAVPVVSRSGEVLGGLFFGHSKTGVFTEAHEKYVVAFAAQAAISMDNARLYRQLTDMNTELENRVAERTAQLREANLELEGFTYSVSHDLRTPLRAISGMGHILLEDYGTLLPREVRPLLERQASASERIAKLIDALLERSRIGRKGMEVVRFDLSAMGRDVSEAIRSNDDQITQCDIHIQPGMLANGDPELISFVLQNLLSNACKFSPKGGWVELGQVGNVFFVRDRGIGFDMKYAADLFEPFKRLVREDEFPGTGLGLANVKRIVERHGGRVWAESKPGHGATFWFTLPSAPPRTE
jgi:PAS domain S-box-containing protein